MKKAIKQLVKLLFGGPLWLLAPLLGYQRRFLVGRHFDDHISGWRMMLRGILFQKILGFNRACPFPVSHRSEISDWKNIEFHPDDYNNFWHFGCYYQNFSAKIKLGRGTAVAPNVGIITANHDPLDLDNHLPGSDIVIGENCWIGMNAMILPGVVLGPRTIVAAGAVVTKSFPDGWCVVAGTPAKVIKNLDRNAAKDSTREPVRDHSEDPLDLPSPQRSELDLR